MLSLHTLNIDSFRNISQIFLSPNCQFNLFYGENGSGKTSLLEAIHYLAFNRSFRTHIHNRMIQHGKDNFLIFAAANEHKIGIERSHHDFRIHLNNKEINSIAPVAEILPMQVIHAHTYQLLEAGPEKRRQFLDWGVFHVEQNFISTWRRYNKALKQRNQALKLGFGNDELSPWNNELIITGNEIDQYRKTYLTAFYPLFLTVLHCLIELNDVEISYAQGWTKDKTLEEVLITQQESDKSLGYTQAGPHRADIKLLINKLPAKDILSRGQQKLFVSSMQIAQGLLMKQQRAYSPIYLIDDLPAELDKEKRARFCQLIQELQAQVFLTCIEPSLLTPFFQDTQNSALFHVEHGTVTTKS